MCASSCIKHYVQPSYDSRGTPVVARTCVYTARKNYLRHNLITKKCWNKNENFFKRMLLKNTRGVGINCMRKSIYLLTTTPTSHTHRFHPLPLATLASCSPHPLTTPIHSTHSPQLSSILLICAMFKVWMTIVESGWNVWVWLVGVVSRRWE